MIVPINFLSVLFDNWRSQRSIFESSQTNHYLVVYGSSKQIQNNCQNNADDNAGDNRKYKREII